MFCYIKKINAIFNIIFNTISKHITNIFIRFYNSTIKYTNKKKIKTTAFWVCARDKEQFEAMREQLLDEVLSFGKTSPSNK